MTVSASAPTIRRVLVPVAAVGVCLVAVACDGDAGPGPSGPSPEWTRIVAGGAHSCALDREGAAYCWGQNDAGQVGIPLTQPSRSIPTRISAPGEYFVLGAGILHSCGLRPGGEARCWGNNETAQLGNDSVEVFSAVPLTVEGAPAFTGLAVGGYHACGLDGDGRARCWGWGSTGQLGTGDLEDRLEPGPVSGGSVFETLAAGDRHTCGLTPEGTAYCWGLGAAGQLGAGDLPDPCGPAGEPACSATPLPVAGDLRFRSLTAGYGHTCGLTPEGAAHCWGWGEFGQLGHGGTGPGASRSAPTPVTGGQRFESLRAGGGFTCGITTGGDALCWGFGDHGQLGSGSAGRRPVPTPVAGDFRFTGLSAGGWHTCALDAAGDARCWGRNHRGQLGTGNTRNSSRPVDVTPPR